jgi:hypothetical protein
MTISRSTASAFPIVQQEASGGPVSVTIPTLGGQGESLLIYTWNYGGGTVSTLEASNGLTFTPFGGQLDLAMGGAIQAYSTVITAAAAGATGVTVSGSIVGTSDYSQIVADEFISGLGPQTQWYAYTGVGISNAASATPVFPSLASASTAEELAYIGYMQPNGVNGTGGTSPIAGAAFTYSSYSDTYVIAFGNIAPSTTYQPVASLASSALSCGFAAVWAAYLPAQTINQPPMLEMQAITRAGSWMKRAASGLFTPRERERIVIPQLVTVR